MSRQKRSDEAGVIYHALNRGNNRQPIFQKPADFEAFIRILHEGLQKYPVEFFAFTLMTNHWHLVLRPAKDGQMGRLLRWVSATHTLRYHGHYHEHGDYLPAKEKANGGAVLICPGGGFSILAWDLEGTEVAEWLNSIGFAAVVVKYRVPTRAHGDALNEQANAPLKAVGPVMDAQRAMSLTRAHAAEWGIDPKRIGIMGFSAGGETAGLTAILGENRLYTKLDAVDGQSSAPNFAMPIYPGGFYDKETAALKPYLKITKETPPMFFAMAQDDGVNCDNCTVLFTALKREKVPAELHIFSRGGHGYGLRPTMTPVTHWAKQAAIWLTDMGFASSPKSLAAPGTPSIGNPSDHLPPNIQQITAFGERPEFSHDAQRVLFLSKQFGDVMEYSISSGKLRCLTQHFKHHGFNRVMMLSNGDYLLTGPDETFDMTDKESRLKARHFAKMLVLDQSLTKPPVPLGVVAAEGPAISRTQLKIAGTHHIEGQSRQTAISTGDLVYENGTPKLTNTRLLLTCSDFPEGQRPKMIETQNFVGPDDKQITVTAYLVENGHNTEGYHLNLDTKQLSNFTNTPDDYEEVEGIFPDGKSTLVDAITASASPGRWSMLGESGSTAATSRSVSHDSLISLATKPATMRSATTDASSPSNSALAVTKPA